MSCLSNRSTVLLKDAKDYEDGTSCSVTIATDDPYAIPKRLGIYREVDSGCAMTTSDIIKRIIDNRWVFFINTADLQVLLCRKY